MIYQFSQVVIKIHTYIRRDPQGVAKSGKEIVILTFARFVRQRVSEGKTLSPGIALVPGRLETILLLIRELMLGPESEWGGWFGFLLSVNTEPGVDVLLATPELLEIIFYGVSQRIHLTIEGRFEALHI